MNILKRLRENHPELDIVAYDGHHSRIGEESSHIMAYIEVVINGKPFSFSAEPKERRKALKPAGILNRLNNFITTAK